MHNAALAALGMGEEWRYQLLPVPPELFAETVRALEPTGFRGANVTIPHKEAALALAADATPTARAIGAANTLTFGPGGAIHAHNTDAEGLIRSLPEPPAGKRALVLGAGGSARAAAWALRDAGAEVMVWNRTPGRAAALAADLGVRAVERAEPADLLVNCTAAGLAAPSETFKELPMGADALGEYACVVDLVYRAGGTALLEAAGRRGSTVVDGLEVLVHQGALSLEAWTGREAPIEAMRQAARDDVPPRRDP